MPNKETKPDYLGHRERLRKRFDADDGKSMADYELLEFVLMGIIPRKDVKPISKRLIKKFGNLCNVLNASSKELKEVEGIGERVGSYLKAICRCSERILVPCLGTISNYLRTKFRER